MLELVAALALGGGFFVAQGRAAVVPCPAEADDGIACTLEMCDTSGNIQRTFDHRRCDDANVCTNNVCTENGCQFVPMAESELDDGNACTQDSCDPKEGILHQPVAIDDDNVCTVDTCDPPVGVKHLPIDPRVDTVCSEGMGGCYAEGKWACDPKSGEVSCTAKADQPKEEICNQIDDDCNGVVDNVARLGEVCTDGEAKCLVTGVLECKPDGQLACSVIAGDGSAEKCDGIDNDCDGAIDEELARGCYDGPGYAVGVGICKEGRQTCEQGEWSACGGAIFPEGGEICGNNLDDDCDGEINEGCELVKEEGVTFKEDVPDGKEVAREPVATEREEKVAERPRAVGQEAPGPAEQTETTPKTTEAAGTVFPVVITKGRERIPEEETPVEKRPDQRPTSAKRESPPAKKESIAGREAPPAREKEPAPTKPRVPLAKKEPEPARFKSSCRSTIFSCPDNLTVYLPFKHRDAAVVVPPVAVQDEPVFANQMLLVTGHNRESAALAYLAARDISPDGKFAFQSVSISEPWRHLVVGAIDGPEKNDLIVVTTSYRYGYVLNIDRLLPELEGGLSAIPLIVPETAEETVVAVHQLQAVPWSENEVKIFGVVEAERSESRRAILGLHIFSLFNNGEAEGRFYKIKDLAKEDKIEAVRVEAVPDPLGRQTSVAVVVAGNGVVNWYDCAVEAADVSCLVNEAMAGIFPLVVSSDFMISSEGSAYELESVEGKDHRFYSRASALGHLRRGGAPVENFNPLRFNTRAMVAQMEAVGQNLFLNTAEALVGHRILSSDEEKAFSFDVLEKEYLTGDSLITKLYTDGTLILSNPTQPLALMHDLVGGIDLVAFFEVQDAAGKTKEGTAAAFFFNRNERHQLELENSSGEEGQVIIPVSVFDETDDPIAVEARLRDEAGNEVSGACLLSVDPEKIVIDQGCLEGEPAAVLSEPGVGVSKSSESVLTSFEKKLDGKVMAKDQSGLLVGKEFSISQSGGVVVIGDVTEGSGVTARGPLADADGPADPSAIQTDGPKYGISGGGCHLRIIR